MKKSVYLSSLLVLCCSLFSFTAMAQAPVITTDPSNVTVCTGSTTLFRIAATGATTYMWQRSADGGTTWDTVHNNATYSGDNNDTLTIITNLTLNGYKYRCIAFDATPLSDTSTAATLGVDGTSAGTITGPTNVCIGVPTSFSSSVPGGVWSNINHTIDTTTPGGIVTGLAYGSDSVRYTLVNTCGTYVIKKQIKVDTVLIAKPITGPTAVCVGNMITIMNANSTGIWSVTNSHVSLSATTVPSITVTGVSAGLDTVMYTVSNSCNTVTSNKFITAETALAPGTVTGTATVCAGSWVLFTASATGGTWISGNPAVAVVASSGFVTGISQGTSVISYYRSNSCGASYATLTATVQAPAAAINGNDSVGIDSTLLLTDITPGGTWTSADTNIAKVSATGLVTGMDTGVTTITYAVTNTCGSSYSVITMNVGPLPFVGAIAGPDSVCVGATITLTDTITGGTWFSKGDTTATITASGVVTGVEYGMDTILYTVTSAFGRTTVMKKVFVNQPPVITITGPASVSFGGGYTLIGTPPGGTWSTNNPGMANLYGYGFFVVLDTGKTRFTYTAHNTCGTSSSFFDIHLPGHVSGVNNLSAGKLNIFPNPTTGNITVDIVTAVTEEVAVSMTDASGRVVKEFKVMSNTPTEVAIGQPAGIYLLTATTQNGNRHTARISVTN